MAGTLGGRPRLFGGLGGSSALLFSVGALGGLPRFFGGDGDASLLAGAAAFAFVGAAFFVEAAFVSFAGLAAFSRVLFVVVGFSFAGVLVTLLGDAAFVGDTLFAGVFFVVFAGSASSAGVVFFAGLFLVALLAEGDFATSSVSASAFLDEGVCLRGERRKPVAPVVALVAFGVAFFGAMTGRYVFQNHTKRGVNGVSWCQGKMRQFGSSRKQFRSHVKV